MTIILTMPDERRFRIVYDHQVATHLASIDSKHHSLIHRTIEEQLTVQPDVETRNRKPLRRPSALGGVWELRLGPDNRFRVFYNIDRIAARVGVVAIGEKDDSTLRIGGEVFDL